MKYERFEQLPVWQAAIELADRVLVLADDRVVRSCGDLRSQISRASISISNNIAEGFERGTSQELLTFLYIARGSAGEVRSMLRLMERGDRFSHLRSQISDLISRCESISRQLRGWADSLQNSSIKGQRYLNESSRSAHEQKKRADALWEHLQRVRESGGESAERSSWIRQR